METIAYAQVQELVLRLPAKKLPFAYSFLVELAKSRFGNYAATGVRLSMM
jgi:hypothetical protein